MSVRAVVAALCVFLGLLASPVVGEGARVWDAAVVADPVPVPKPDRDAALPEGVSIARQCPASTMMARAVEPDGTRVFYARFSRTVFDGLVAQGCTAIRQGCNVCHVAYTGCTADERAACTDGDCLARVCTRRTICTMKGCTAQGTMTPPCDARFAVQACLETAFDATGE